MSLIPCYRHNLRTLLYYSAIQILVLEAVCEYQLDANKPLIYYSENRTLLTVKNYKVLSLITPFVKLCYRMIKSTTKLFHSPICTYYLLDRMLTYLERIEIIYPKNDK